MQHRLDEQTNVLLARLLESGITKLAEQAIPLGLPDAVPKHSGRKKRVVGGSRIETGSEVAERTAKLRERALKKALAKEPTFKLITVATRSGPGLTEQQVATRQLIKFASLMASPPHLLSEDEDELKPCPTTPPTSVQLSHKRSHSIMVDRTPTKPVNVTPILTPPVPTPLSTSATLTNNEDDYKLPLSTAPASLGRRRTNKVNSQQDWRAILIPKKRGDKK
jgi:hypothetical protein